MVKDQQFNKIDMPIMVGMKFGPARVQLGPIASIVLSNKSALADYGNYEEEFNGATWGYQVGVGLDLGESIILDAKYEGSLSRLGKGVKIGGETRNFDSRTNQFVVGIDQELVRDLKIGLSFLYKHKKNIIDDVPYDVETGEYWYNPNESPGNKYWIPFKTTVPAVGKDFPATTVNMWFLSNDAPRNWIYQVQNVPEAFRKYWAFELSFEKRMSNGWQLGGSINYSKSFSSRRYFIV